MSAHFDKKDGAIYAPHKCNAFEEAMFVAYFDQQVDYDLEIMKKEKEEALLLRRMSWVKVLTFPILYPFTRIFLGSIMAADVSNCNRIYWKFLRRKINVAQFKKELADSLKQVKNNLR